MRFYKIIGIALAAGLVLPAAIDAATCDKAAGPIAILRFEIGSNPVCSGQDLVVSILSRNCSAQNHTINRVIDVFDATDHFVATALASTVAATGSLHQFQVTRASTAGAPPFTGKIRLTDFVGGQASDVVELPIAIVPPCPALPPPIPGYIAQ